MDAVFVALADATRRSVLEVLASGGAASATQLSTRFPMTRQAIAKHLQILSDAGLVRSERAGRETLWELTPAALSPAMGWMADLGGGFDDRVAALQRHLGERHVGRGLPSTGPLHIAARGQPPLPPGR